MRVWLLQGSKLSGCVVGINSYIGRGSTLENTLVLGNDYYTNDKSRALSLEKGESALGIGANPRHWAWHIPFLTPAQQQQAPFVLSG
jgi:hypothetical protein